MSRFSGDTLRLANADRRNARRLTVLSASKARHTQRTRNNIAAHPVTGPQSTHAVAEYFQVPGDRSTCSIGGLHGAAPRHAARHLPGPCAY